MEMVCSGAFYALFMTSKDPIVTDHEPKTNSERAHIQNCVGAFVLPSPCPKYLRGRVRLPVFRGGCTYSGVSAG